MRIMRINSKKYKHMAPRRVFFMGYTYAAKAGSYISIAYINKYKKKIWNKNPFFKKKIYEIKIIHSLKQDL